MSKKTANSGAGKRLAALDPTLPSTTVTLDGMEYRLCLNHRALAEAEMRINASGHKVNLLMGFPAPPTYGKLLILFPCALHKYNPDIVYEKAVDLVTPDNAWLILEALRSVWKLDMAEPEEDAPSPPAAVL